MLLLRVSWHGLGRKTLKNFDHVLVMVFAYSVIFFLVYWDWKHLLILKWIFPNVFTSEAMRFFVLHVPQFLQGIVLAGAPTVLLGISLGIVHFSKITKYQNDLKHIGLKSATGMEPKVIDVEEAGVCKRKLTIASQGVGLEHYKSKKSDLESALGAIVENICVSERSRKFVEIHLVDRELPTIVGYKECTNVLTEPYSFVIGESLNGVLGQSIRSLPHLLIAGTSGNGKSVFFNQTLISLMRTSPYIQLYLLDLKLGVEVRAYNELPNARIAKDGPEAIQLLSSVVKEMKLRFEYLEKHGYKQIEPLRDKRDLILVGVDEASVLYGKRRGDRSGNELIANARDLTDEIAKLGRAASIHLVLATQKVTNESIDTKIQENIGGRVCFRVNTLQGSNTVLGNKKAFDLPDVKGRAIWANGNDFTEVQTPFVSDGLIELEIKGIMDEFKSGKRRCWQNMVADKTLEKNQSDHARNAALDRATKTS